jgi:hypothetical protein
MGSKAEWSEAEKSFRAAELDGLRKELEELQYNSATARTPHLAATYARALLDLSKRIAELERQDAQGT